MSKYKVGDKVRVREWEDMANEFGIDACGDIDCEISFVTSMAMFCGRVVTIKDVNGNFYEIEEDNGEWEWRDYMFRNISFCLDDIREEMIVMLRSGEFYVSIGVRFINAEGYIPRCNYCKNMEHKTGKTLYDIVAVYQPSRLYKNGFDGMLTPNSEPIWKEKKRIEIPEPDRTILENINEEYKYIVRDHAGDIFVCTRKPEKHKYYWLGKEKSYPLTAFNHLFQFVQWTDEKPVNFREALAEMEETNHEKA